MHDNRRLFGVHARARVRWFFGVVFVSLEMACYFAYANTYRTTNNGPARPAIESRGK